MTTSGELGFRHQKSTRDDLLLTDVGVRFPKKPGRTKQWFLLHIVSADLKHTGSGHRNVS